jgi:hypothetical protein
VPVLHLLVTLYLNPFFCGIGCVLSSDEQKLSNPCDLAAVMDYKRFLNNLGSETPSCCNDSRPIRVDLELTYSVADLTGKSVRYRQTRAAAASLESGLRSFSESRGTAGVGANSIVTARARRRAGPRR